MVLVVVGLLGSAAEASAQIDLSRALNSLLGSEKSSTNTTGEPTKTPYDYLAERAPSPSKITGVWLYHSAAIEYLGTLPFADVALSQLEAVGLAELRAKGVVPGFFGLTVRRNGVVYLSYEDEIYEGSYSYNATDASLKVEASVDGTAMTADGYLKIEDGRLVLMLDARDVMSILLKAYPEYRNNSTVLSAESTLRSFDGVYLAIRFSR